MTLLDLSVSGGDSFSEALNSVIYELFILATFIGSYALWRIVTSSKSHFHASQKPKQRSHKGGLARVSLSQDRHDVGLPTLKVAEHIMSMCSDEFTRALRLYRALVAQGRDGDIKDEAFYFTLLQAAIRVGSPDVVEQLLNAVLRHDIRCSPDFFSSILKLLAAKHFYSHCIMLYQLLGDRLPQDRIIYSCLAFAALECKDLSMATDMSRQLILCDGVSSKDFINLFRMYSKTKDYQRAIQLFRRLLVAHKETDTVILNMVLAACVSAKQVPMAVELLNEFTQKGENARNPRPDVVTYNTVMKGLVEQNDTFAAFKLLDEMQEANVSPDDVTYGTLLDSCIADNDLDKANEVIDKLTTSGCTMNTVLYTTFMKGFVRAQMLEKAMQLYENMKRNPGSCRPDLITYSVLIKANCDRRDMKASLHLLQDMLSQGYEPDDIVLNHLLDGCCHTSNVELGRSLFMDMTHPNGTIHPSPYTLSTMVKLFGKCGKTDEAFLLVSSMEQQFKVKPSVVIFTCLMSGCIRNRKLKEAFAVFEMMQAHGVPPDETTYAILIQGMIQNGSAEEAVAMVLRSPEDSRLPSEALNSLLHTLLSKSMLESARKLYFLMMKRKLSITVPSVCRRLKLQE